MNAFIYSNELIESMKAHLENEKFKFITCPKFVFLCGKAYSPDLYFETNRGIVDKYFRSMSKDVYIVLSERLWEESFNSNIDLLTFEEFLAEVSDTIVLFVESAGSFCELGAFAYAEKVFSDKLIIVVDEKYKHDKSFIITGPVAKAEKDGAKVVYAPLEGTGLLSSNSLRELLYQIVRDFGNKSAKINKRQINRDAGKVSLNSFILELLELVRILQPISRSDLITIYKQVKGFPAFKFIKKDGSDFHNEIKYDYVIKLLQTVGLITLQGDMISSSNPQKQAPFMLSYSLKAENQERNRLICRKYRYKGTIK